MSLRLPRSEWLAVGLTIHSLPWPRRFVIPVAFLKSPPVKLRIGEPNRARQLACQRICMARLRAERDGMDTAGFPPRVRARK